MSFNQHDIIIDRSNYEEYFLLYIDGELSDEQVTAVESFAKLHPDLQEELSILLSTKLNTETEPVFLKSKQHLFADNMKMNVIEESLLLYIDNELSAVEKKAIDQQMKINPALQLQYQLLQKAKLDAGDKMTYPYKAGLYHTVPKATRPVFWLRMAAAIILILSIGILWWTNIDNKVQPNVALHLTPAIKNLPVNADSSLISIPVLKSLPAENRAEKEVIQRSSKNNIAKKKIITTQPTPLQPLEKNKEQIAALETNPGIDRKINTIEASIKPQQNLNKQAVTTDAIPAYTISEAPANKSMATFAVASTGNQNDKKGSVRGFLRKASRFIERCTGINPVNEDDELLIGALAIKL